MKSEKDVTRMQQRTIGDVQVGAIGLGAMPMSIEGRPEDESRSIATIHAALDCGVTLIDTADTYHLPLDEADGETVGHNERLIAKALSTWKGDKSTILVATKGGHLRPTSGPWAIDGRPEHLKEAAKASAARLGVDALGLYQHHRPDPQVPYEESIGALAELLDEGVIRMAGISNVNREQIRTAQQALGGRLVSVQNEFSPAFRSSQPELELCTELGIAFLPYSPLGGIGKAGQLGERFAPFARVAEQRGVSPQQVCLAWELALSPVVIPIPGASRPASTQDSALAADLVLTADEVALLGAN